VIGRLRTVLFSALLMVPVASVVGAATAGAYTDDGVTRAASEAGAVDATATKIPTLLRLQAAKVGAELAAQRAPGQHTAGLSQAQLTALSADVLGVDARGGIDVLVHAAAPATAYSVAQGELPADVHVVKQAAYDGDEGTAMLEIIHDIAPGAELAFATTGETLAEYVEAFHLLAAAGVSMITEEIALDDEPAFQQGIGAATAEALAQHGIWVSSSAGNLGARPSRTT